MEDAPLRNMLRDDPASTLIERFLGGNGESTRFPARTDLFALLLIYPLLVCAYFLPLTGGGRVLSSGEGDVAFLWLFEREYLGTLLRAMALPLWNPWMMCGTPFLASSQSGVFYPPNWLHAFLPAAFVVNAQTILHFWFGLAAMHALVRQIGRSALAAAMSALVFGFSGFAILHWCHGHLVFVVEWPWTPVALMCWVAIQGGSRRAVAAAFLLAGALAMQFFSGHPQIVYFTLLVLAALELGWLAFALRNRDVWTALHPRLLRSSGLFVAALLAAGLLCAVQALPTFLHASETIRYVNAPASYYEEGSQPLQDMVTAFAPWAFGGRPGGPTYSGIESYWEVTGFVGVTAICLIVALFFAPRLMCAMEWTCLLLAAAAWWLALGVHGGLYRRLFDVLPGLALFRMPGRFVYIVTFAVAMLTAFGFDRLCHLARERKRDFGRCVLGLAAIVVGGAVLYLVLFRRGAESPVFQAMMRGRMHLETLETLRPQVVRALFGTYASGMTAAFVTAVAVIAALALLARRSLQRGARLIVAGLLACELLLFVWPYRESFRLDEILWPPEIVKHLQSAGTRYRVGTGSAQTDLAQGMRFAVPVVFGDEPLVSHRFSESVMVSQGAERSSVIQSIAITRGSPFTDAIAMRYLLLDPRQPHPGAAWTRGVQSGSWVLYETDAALPRGYTVANARMTTDPVADVNSSHFNPATTVLLEEPHPAVTKDQTTAGVAPGDVQVVADTAERFRALVSMRAPGWFVLMDSSLNGWKASVGGAPAKLFRANSTGRALYLQAGEHEVAMTYHAPGFAVGAAMSSCAWILWASGLGIALVRRRTGHHIREGNSAC
jgi:hypothetical protein